MNDTIVNPTDLQAFIQLIQVYVPAGKLLVWLPGLSLLASLLDAALPPPVEGSVWVNPRRVLHFFAVNFGNARNAIPAGAIPATVAAKAVETKAAADNAVDAAGELGAAMKGTAESITNLTKGFR